MLKKVRTPLAVFFLPLCSLFCSADNRIMPSYRRYALTFNNSAPDFVFDTDIIRYFIAGEEVGEEKKRLHYQAYIELFQKTSLSKLKEIVDDNTVHAEACKGTPAENIAYCTKDSKLYREEGTPANLTQGKRTDLISLRTHFQQHKRLKTAIEDDVLIGPVARYPRFVNTLTLMYSLERSEPTQLYVYWGVPGSGKSHKAYTEAKSLGAVYFKPAGAWWDGYSGQTTVIFEDFRGETGFPMLLRLADRYPLRVPFKGGFHQFVSSRIVITSNLDITEWFNSDARGYDVSLQALRRRITEKVHFPVRWTAPKEADDLIGL